MSFIVRGQERTKTAVCEYPYHTLCLRKEEVNKLATMEKYQARHENADATERRVRPEYTVAMLQDVLGYVLGTNAECTNSHAATMTCV